VTRGRRAGEMTLPREGAEIFQLAQEHRTGIPARGPKRKAGPHTPASRPLRVRESPVSRARVARFACASRPFPARPGRSKKSTSLRGRMDRSRGDHAVNLASRPLPARESSVRGPGRSKIPMRRRSALMRAPARISW
jgi:hypothetical protein